GVRLWKVTFVRFAARRQLVILVLISCQLASRSDLNFLPTGLSGATAIALVQCGQSPCATLSSTGTLNLAGFREFERSGRQRLLLLGHDPLKLRVQRAVASLVAADLARLGPESFFPDGVARTMPHTLSDYRLGFAVLAEGL